MEIKNILIFAGAGAVAGLLKGLLGYFQQNKTFNAYLFCKTIVSTLVIGAIGGALTSDLYAAVSAGLLGEEALKFLPQYKELAK